MRSARRNFAGFTIVEVLVVLAIILVLAGLILATSSYVHNKGARSRAEAEIAAMSAALENYRADNGVYPLSATPDARENGDPLAQIYKDASLVLYRALSGDTDLNRQAEATSYMSFKPNQLSPNDQASAVTFLKDPFGNSYGYSTAGQAGGATGYNPTFDLWSTAGTSTTGTPSPLPWIKNW
ncbi:MAG: type II secretion system GspH family protein [Verrucomicrobiota bacterium]|nr:prepilin-type N-terminal cleavage/methylation domain-containing protein [Chthoniobacterales bacterium]MDQ3415223.1 type II secretion system GspH family protein [Verrucomicrobiota bacterium]